GGGRGGDSHVAIDRNRKHEPSAVIGVLADDVHAAWCRDHPPGRPAVSGSELRGRSARQHFVSAYHVQRRKGRGGPPFRRLYSRRSRSASDFTSRSLLFFVSASAFR